MEINIAVILDKDNYEMVDNIISSLMALTSSTKKNHYPKIINEIKSVMAKCNNFITPQLKIKLNDSKPTIPKLHYLSKIHKTR